MNRWYTRYKIQLKNTIFLLKASFWKKAWNYFPNINKYSIDAKLYNKTWNKMLAIWAILKNLSLNLKNFQILFLVLFFFFFAYFYTWSIITFYRVIYPIRNSVTFCCSWRISRSFWKIKRDFNWKNFILLFLFTFAYNIAYNPVHFYHSWLATF